MKNRFLISQVRCADMPAARQTNHSVVFWVNKSKSTNIFRKEKSATLRKSMRSSASNISHSKLSSYAEYDAEYADGLEWIWSSWSSWAFLSFCRKSRITSSASSFRNDAVPDEPASLHISHFQPRRCSRHQARCSVPGQYSDLHLTMSSASLPHSRHFSGPLARLVLNAPLGQ